MLPAHLKEAKMILNVFSNNSTTSPQPNSHDFIFSHLSYVHSHVFLKHSRQNESPEPTLHLPKARHRTAIHSPLPPCHRINPRNLSFMGLKGRGEKLSFS